MPNAFAESHLTAFHFDTVHFDPAIAPKLTHETIAVVGLGYVCLPLAVQLAERFETVYGFDINIRRIESLRQGSDWTNEVDAHALQQTDLRMTEDARLLQAADFFIVAVPTPVDASHQPDLTPLRSACRMLGKYLQEGAVVVFESTVYPGATEEVCAVELAKASGLRAGIDFNIAYSPERISPGDQTHGLGDVTKIVSADTPETLERVCAVYENVVDAGLHRAPSIRVAEAAKVFENTQRDVNIGLVNEFSTICDHLGIRTMDVIEATGTKWNALHFTPGLVGGHCIGVDPYYLTYKAEEYGINAHIMRAGRQMNERMAPLIAQRVVKHLGQNGRLLNDARVGVLGVSFKENVPDLRNSKTFDLILELQSFGIKPINHDPVVDAQAAQRHGIRLSAYGALHDLDALILAVPHDAIMNKMRTGLLDAMRDGGLIYDVKSALSPDSIPSHLTHLSL